MRTLFGLLCGVVLAGLGWGGLQAAGHIVFPPPAPLSLTNPADYLQILKIVSPEGQIAIAAAWLLGSLIGGLAANWIAGRVWPALLIALLVSPAAMLSLTFIRHPLWMELAALGLPLAGALVAMLFSLGRRHAD